MYQLAYPSYKEVPLRSVWHSVFEELMCFSCDASFHYADYKAVFEKENGALPLSFHVSTDSSKVNNRLARMRTMRVGNEFEIKVLNPAAQIENGYDSDKKKSFYKLYYKQ